MTRLFNLLRTLGFEVTSTETVEDYVGEPGPNSKRVWLSLPGGRTLEVKWTWPARSET